MTPTELKRIRAALGLTQEGLAEALGVTKSAVSRWEAGLRTMPETAARLVGRIAKEVPKRKR